MLDYANSLNQKHGIPRLKIVCLGISCLFHFCVIMALFLFPQLLAGGYLHQFRGFNWGTTVTDEEMELWRMVALLEPPDRMNMPSPETLRKLLGSGDRDEGAGSPPIEVRFGPPEALLTDKPPLPQVPPKIEEPEIVIPDDRGPGADDETKPDAGSPKESPKTEPADPGTGRDILAAKPEAAPKVEIAANTAPRKIPEGITPPAPPPAQPPAVKPAAANEAASGSSVGLFDTGGFPMGDYREIIEARVRSKWFIPINLKDSLGKTTVVFYIGRNGRVIDLRVEAPSGNRSLDLAALSAVMGAEPFPPLPKDFPGERVGVRLSLIVDP
jgi:protein TonB